jgi:hypothetical protein
MLGVIMVSDVPTIKFDGNGGKSGLILAGKNFGDFRES